MESKKVYIGINNLEVYKLSRELSDLAWDIYEPMDWQVKKVMGDQFLTATDSVGANIAEGYGRYHFLDKIKFFYNARASLIECNDHWIELLNKRQKISDRQYKQYKEIAEKLSKKLQNFINANYRSKNKE